MQHRLKVTGLNLSYQSHCLVHTSHLYVILHYGNYTLNVLREGTFSRGRILSGEIHILSWLKSGSYIKCHMICNNKRLVTIRLPISKRLVKSNTKYYAVVKKKEFGLPVSCIYYYEVIATIKCEVKKTSWKQVCKVYYCLSNIYIWLLYFLKLKNQTINF